MCSYASRNCSCAPSYRSSSRITRSLEPSKADCDMRPDMVIRRTSPLVRETPARGFFRKLFTEGQERPPCPMGRGSPCVDGRRAPGSARATRGTRVNRAPTGCRPDAKGPAPGMKSRSRSTHDPGERWRRFNEPIGYGRRGGPPHARPHRGGSLVGLSTSLFLGRLGVPHTLVERHAGTSIHPRGRGNNVRTMELFRTAGVDGRIVEAASVLADNHGILQTPSLVGTPASGCSGRSTRAGDLPASARPAGACAARTTWSRCCCAAPGNWAAICASAPR